MADFQAQVSIDVVCDECGKEIDASVGGRNWDKKLMVERCDCKDNELNNDGYNSRDDEVYELKSDISAMKERVKDLEAELERLDRHTRNHYEQRD